MKIQYKLPSLQGKIFDAVMSDAKMTLVESGTKTGKTVGYSVWLLAYCLNNPKSKVWWVAPTRKQAKIGYRYMKNMIHETHRNCNETDLMIYLKNGSVVECRTGDVPDNLFGEGIELLVVDEASRVKEAAWEALQTTILVSGGQIKIAGNPKGKKNWFHQLCREAERYSFNPQTELRKQYEYFHITSYESPYVQADELERMKSIMRPAQFRELVEGIAEDGSSQVFGNVLLNCDGAFCEPIFSESFVMGYDIGGLTSQSDKPKNDYGCCVVMNTKGNVCYLERWKDVTFEQQIADVLMIQKRYNNAKIFYDSTGTGNVVKERFEMDRIKSEPFLFTNTSKVMLIYGLVNSMEMRRVHYPPYPAIVEELESFEHEYTVHGNEKFQAASSTNDDIVIAIALANYGLYGTRVKREIQISTTIGYRQPRLT